MKKPTRRIVRIRMAMGMLLLLCAALFVWERSYTPHDELPRFGYDDENGDDLPAAEYSTDDGFLLEPSMHDFMNYDHESRLAVLHEMIFADAHQNHEPDEQPPLRVFTAPPDSPEYIEQLMDFEFLRRNIYLEDPSTMLLPTDIDVHEFINADLRIDATAPGPHVLIFHTHTTEWFADTERHNPATGIVAVGAYLADVLTTHYGLEVLHFTGSFDIVNGQAQILGAYERMEPVITALLAETPTIQLVIDLHRDGVREGAGPFTHEIEGVPTARLMFFNGLSRRNINGEAVPATWLPNPYQRENLQFSFQAQLAANRLFPNFNRRIYLRAYRFSLHMHPRTLFVEVGNQYNTLQEAKNAMHPLARIIAEVVLGG